MHIIILILAIICAYANLPQPLQIILALANVFIPDFVPVIDEAIMLAIAFRNL